jgi:hypothetical protein
VLYLQHSLLNTLSSQVRVAVAVAQVSSEAVVVELVV